MDWSAAGTIGGFVLTAFAGYGIFIKLASKVEAIDERMKEDRDKNECQHNDFYKVRDTVTSLNTALPEMNRRLEAIERSIEKLTELIQEIRK